MKRDRDSEEDSGLIGPNRPFRMSPESTCSNHNTTTTLPPINATKNNNNNNNENNNNINNKEQDRFLPIANVGRIMKKVIPGNGKISKDAKETVQECVSEFISFVTGEASDKCQREKRKTINGDDILWAIMTLGFEDYVNPLKLYLTKYRELEGEKLNVPKPQQQQQQQRVEQYDQQKSDHMPQYNNINNVYSSTNLIPQPSFASSNDHPFSLPFSQNSFQTTTRPQQDHIDENW